MKNYLLFRYRATDPVFWPKPDPHPWFISVVLLRIQGLLTLIDCFYYWFKEVHFVNTSGSLSLGECFRNRDKKYESKIETQDTLFSWSFFMIFLIPSEVYTEHIVQ